MLLKVDFFQKNVWISSLTTKQDICSKFVIYTERLTLHFQCSCTIWNWGFRRKYQIGFAVPWSIRRHNFYINLILKNRTRQVVQYKGALLWNGCVSSLNTNHWLASRVTYGNFFQSGDMKQSKTTFRLFFSFIAMHYHKEWEDGIATSRWAAHSHIITWKHTVFFSPYINYLSNFNNEVVKALGAVLYCSCILQ